MPQSSTSPFTIVAMLLASIARALGRRVSFNTAGLLLVMSVVLPLLASGEEYLPLWIGNRWDYRGIGGAAETQRVDRTVRIWGTETFAIHYEASTSNEGLENFWTTEGGGDVFLWGFDRTLENWGVLYQPAIRVVDAPLYVGKVWSDSVAFYFLPDTVYAGAFKIAWEVYEAGAVAVPAGNFFAYGIGQTLPPLLAQFTRYSLTGATAPEALADGWATDWYSDAVGRIQYEADDLYQLTFYVQPTPVQETTWGRVKSRFRW